MDSQEHEVSGRGLVRESNRKRDSIENKRGTAHPQWRSAKCILSALLLIIESGSLSVALSPEESAGGVAGSVTSTVYATTATKL